MHIVIAANHGLAAILAFQDLDTQFLVVSVFVAYINIYTAKTAPQDNLGNISSHRLAAGPTTTSQLRTQRLLDPRGR